MKIEDLNKKIKEERVKNKDQGNFICDECHDVGYICKVFGETKTCLKCLRAGRLG